ncbi:MAG: glucose-1-phosphate thymidylyltransferase [Armatimonadetes bacterium]|nr:glucose-1-phosphate thymidylyltransferase [Armatimonadota bacterium]
MQLRTAVVLCAGLGSRLWPVTLNKPKVLVPVAGRSILDRIFDDLVRANISRAVLVVSPWSDVLRQYVADHAPEGLEVSFVVQEEARGLGHATATAREAVGDEPFLLYLGDELLEGGVEEFLDVARKADAGAVVLLKEVPEPQRFGVAVLDGDRVVKLVEKPANPPSSLAVVGLYVFQPVIFEAIAQTPESARGEIEITDAIQLLADKGHKVVGVVSERQWYDVGTHDALLEANRFLMDREVTETPLPTGERCNIIGRCRVAHDAEAIDCEVFGPVIIGHGCSIRRSRIGPYVCIGDNTCVEDSVVEDSIIGTGCHLRGVGKLYHSVLDDEVRIQGSGTPVAVSLTAGRRTTLRLEPPET